MQTRITSYNVCYTKLLRATIEDIRKHKFVLTPGRYVGIPDEEDDGIPFQEKVDTLTSKLRTQMDEAQVLDKEIAEQLAKIGIKL